MAVAIFWPQSNVSRNRDLLLLGRECLVSGLLPHLGCWWGRGGGGGGGGGSGRGLPLGEAVRVRTGHWLACRLLCASSYCICFLKRP